MKGEYALEPNKETTASPNTNMFSKLHPHSHLALPLQECKTPEDDNNSRSTKGGNDGATIEIIRRPRGRPPGSKNKPKPPVIITRNTEPAMSPYILEIQAGKDIIEAVSCFSDRKKTGLCVLSGSGTVANVTLKQPSATPGSTVTFHGRYDILSFSATLFASTSLCPIPSCFTISLAGPQGQIVGGIVAGSLLAAATVYLVAASFTSPEFHRLPAASGVGAAADGQQKCVSGGGDGQSPAVSGGGESCGVSMYSCQMGSDVVWAPSGRQPQPPY